MYSWGRSNTSSSRADTWPSSLRSARWPDCLQAGSAACIFTVLRLNVPGSNPTPARRPRVSSTDRAPSSPEPSPRRSRLCARLAWPSQSRWPSCGLVPPESWPGSSASRSARSTNVADVVESAAALLFIGDRLTAAELRDLSRKTNLGHLELALHALGQGDVGIGPRRQANRFYVARTAFPRAPCSRGWAMRSRGRASTRWCRSSSLHPAPSGPRFPTFA